MPMVSPTLAFWLLAALMVGVALAFVLPRLIGRERASRSADRARLNAEIYAGELADIARDEAAGTLAPAEAEHGRREIARRLLEDAAAPEAPAGASRGRGAGLAVAAALPAFAVGLYLAFGTPAALDGAPLPAQAHAGDAAAFRAQLARHLADAPRDGRAWVALARLDMAEDRYAEAAAGFAKALEASAKIARDPDVLCEYADALGMVQGGRLDGRPHELIERALALDPANPRALEMAGSAAYGRGDYRAAARHWRTLLDRLPAGTPAHAELAAAVERAERLASTALPPPRGG